MHGNVKKKKTSQSIWVYFATLFKLSLMMLKKGFHFLDRGC